MGISPVPPHALALVTPAGQLSGTTKVAVTFTSAVIETVQVLVPVQPPPDQPANADPSATVAAAVKTTVPLPPANSSEHVVPHAIPVGADVTVPVPSPALLTVSACPAPQLPPALVPVPGVKAPLRQKHSPLPSKNQHPLDIPAAAIAVSHWSWHSALVSWPRSFSATVPLAQPKAVATVVHPNGGTNVAVTALATVTDTVQVAALPEQPPPVQPANAEPLAAVAVRVTLVP
jgi:hypothetical protein